MKTLPVLVYAVCEIRNRHSSFQDHFTETEEVNRESRNQVRAMSIEGKDDEEFEMDLPDMDEDEYEIYEVKEQREKEEAERRMRYLLFSEESVQARGGIEGLEYDLGDTCRWFAPIGRIQIPRTRGRKIQVPLSMIQSLIDAWRACDAPKQFGWRIKGVELNRTVHRVITENAGRLESAQVQNRALHYHLSGAPSLENFQMIIRRLDAGEVVKINFKSTLICEEIMNDEFWPVEEEQFDNQIWLWREEVTEAFRVRAEIHPQELEP